MFALTLFGAELPDISLLLGIAVLLFGYLLINRGTPKTKGFGGRGQMWRCPRCGVDFQKERVQYLDNGEETTHYDDRCPNCGWDYDWGDPDKKRR